MGAVPQEVFKIREVLGSGDDKDLSYPRQHENGQGVINHGFIIYGEELLAHPPRNGIEPRPGTSRQNNSFHLAS